MQIYIPTFMREDRQKAFRHLPPGVSDLITFVTHSGRADILRQAQPNMRVLDLGITDGIADVRQKILDQSTDNKVMIIDDQCRFKRRKSDMKYEKMDYDGHIEMFNKIEKELDEFAMVGICDRTGNQNILVDRKSPARMYSVYGINKQMWLDNDISFDGMYRKNSEIKLYEDFYAVLSMLTKGMPNLLMCDYIFESEHGIKGGNSTIRDNALQKKCIEALIAEFPKFVTMVKKEDVGWTTDPGKSGERHEVRVKWKDAYESFNKSTSSLDDFF